MADITITEIALENTLLLDAINKGKARFVSDCASYLQASDRSLPNGSLLADEQEQLPAHCGYGVDS